MSQASASGSASNDSGVMSLSECLEALNEIVPQLPASDFRQSFFVYLRLKLSGTDFVNSIKEDFPAVRDLFGDPAFTRATLRIFRDMLIRKGVTVDKRQGVRLAGAVAKAVYGMGTFDARLEELIKVPASNNTENGAAKSANTNAGRPQNSSSTNGTSGAALSQTLSQRFRTDDSKYDGSLDSSILEYVSDYVATARDLEMSEDDKLKYFHTLFRGQAKRFYYSRVEQNSRTFADAKEMMENEFNSLARQNRILGMISSLRFERFRALHREDPSAALDALTAKISDYSQMIPREYRHDSHLKRFLHNACIGEPWASHVLSRATAEPTWSFTTMSGYLSAAMQQHSEEQRARAVFSFGRPPVVPAVMYEETRNRDVSGPMFYGKKPGSSGSKNAKGKGPGPDARCRGCGSPHHWLRDGKCSGKDVAEFIKKRLGDYQSPARILHELCLDEADDGAEIFNDPDQTSSLSDIVDTNLVYMNGNVAHPKASEVYDKLLSTVLAERLGHGIGDITPSHGQHETDKVPEIEEIPETAQNSEGTIQNDGTRSVQFQSCNEQPPPVALAANVLLKGRTCSDPRSERVPDFHGACLDSGAQKSVAGLPQARAYMMRTRNRLSPRSGDLGFKFGDTTHKSLGTMPFHVSTPGGILSMEIDVVDADVPLLLGLDVLDAHKLVVNNVDDVLEFRDERKKGHVAWTIPLTRKHGHLFLSQNVHVVNLSSAELQKLHRHFAHPSAERLFALIKRARPAEADARTREILDDIRASCDICQRTQRRPLTFKVAAIPEIDLELQFNRQVDADIMWIARKPVLHLVDHDTGFGAACFLEGESAEHVWEAFLKGWALVYHGAPHVLLTDQGSVFTSMAWQRLCESEGIKIRLVPIESHNSNGSCESRHGPLRKTFERLKLEFPGISDALALQYAIKAQNDTANPRGIAPSTLVFGTVPRALEEEPQSNASRYKMMAIAKSEYQEAIAKERLRTALESAPPSAADRALEPGGDVLVWREKKGWEGPYLLARVDGRTAFVHDRAGEPRPFSTSAVKPYVSPGSTELGDSDQFSSVSRPAAVVGGNAEASEVTVLATRIIEKDDPVAASAEMSRAKLNELIGLLDRGTFAVVQRSSLMPGANILRTRFVLAIKNPGTSEEIYKARLVVKGFQDKMKGYLVHEPNNGRTVSIRILMALASAYQFPVWSEDVTQAFVQSSGTLLRDVYIEPPKEFQLHPGLLLKLLKPLYGLSDAGDYWSRTMKHHYKTDLKMTPTTGDESFFFQRHGTDLSGLAVTYVDDSLRSGTPQFVQDTRVTSLKFESKRSSGPYIRFAGLDVYVEGSRRISQETYIQKLQQLPAESSFDDYRSLRAKVAWCQNTRPDIAIDVALAAQVTRGSFAATRSENIKALNRCISHLVQTRCLSLQFPQLDTSSLAFHVFSDAAFATNQDFRCQIGFVVFLADRSRQHCVLDYRSTKAQRVTRSVLGGELIAFTEAFDRAFALKHDMEDVTGRRVPLNMYTDSKCLFDVLTKGSTTAERRLQIDIAMARESFQRNWIANVALVPSAENLADGLTKANRSQGLIEVLKSGILRPAVRQWIVR